MLICLCIVSGRFCSTAAEISIVTETTWLTKPEISVFWPLLKKSANPCPRRYIFISYETHRNLVKSVVSLSPWDKGLRGNGETKYPAQGHTANDVSQLDLAWVFWLVVPTIALRALRFIIPNVL